jgi:transcriptional regulator with XRE-family HTH domain
VYIAYVPYSIEMNNNFNLMTLGERIRHFRERKGFSQEAFANSIEMNRGYYGSIERGEVNLTISNFFKIAKGLSMPPSAFFD